MGLFSGDAREHMVFGSDDSLDSEILGVGRQRQSHRGAGGGAGGGGGGGFIDCQQGMTEGR